MEEKYYCDFCHRQTNSFVIGKTHQFNIKNKKIEFQSQVRVCSECNHEIYDFELDNKTSELAIRQYNSEYGIRAEELISFRKQNHLSLSALSKFIGIAKKTLVSYETESAVPNDHYTQILRSIMDNTQVLTELAKHTSEELTNKEQYVLHEIEEKYCHEELSEFNGYYEPNKHRLLQTILYFLAYGIGMTKLNKALFFADFSFYARAGRSITGNRYTRYDFGPFVPELYNIVKRLEDEQKIVSAKMSPEKTDKCTYQSLVEADLSGFLPEEKKVLEKVRNYIVSKSYTTISEDSHLENAWTETEQGQPISYEYALSLKQLF